MEAKLTRRQKVFIEYYLQLWNATEAARRAGFAHPDRQGPRLLGNVVIQTAINQRVDEISMSSNEIVMGISEQARGDLGVFFKLVEEWTFFPLPSYDILDAKEVDILDRDGQPTGEKRVSYLARRVCLDMKRLIDPKYSRLLHKFSDSPKDGLSIEIYSKQTALQTLAKIRGMMVNKTEVTGKNGGPIETKSDGLSDDERVARITALLERARARRDRQSSEEPA